MPRIPVRLASTLLLTGVLAACSQTPAPTTEDTLPPGSPYAGGASYPWSDRLEAPVADPYAAGRDYPWSSPQAASTLATQGLSAGVNQLSDLPWTSASNFWGPISRDKSNGEQGEFDGHTLTIGGQTFAKGLGVHADSTVKYALNAQCSAFTASVGIDDEVGTLGRATFQVLGDGKVLYTSPELTGADTAKAVSVNVSGVRELTLNVLKGANTYYDHSDWADAKVTCQALKPSGTVYVSDLAYTSATNGWGPVEIDRSNGEQGQFDGKPITVEDQVYAKGLGVHANSAITYDLGGQCTAFESVVGVDDEVEARGSVVFQVFGDGRKLYESSVLQGGVRNYYPVARANVTGVRELKLVVTDFGDGKNFDHADWADAKLACSTPGASGTFDPTFGVAGHANVGGVDSVVEPDTSVVLLGADFTVKRVSSAGIVSAAGAAVVPGGTAMALARQANGNLVAVGQANSAVVVVRYLPSLQPDPSFGTGGVVVVQYGQAVPDALFGPTAAVSSGRDVAVQADGGVVIVGTASRAFTSSPGVRILTPQFLVARLSVTGTVDTTFGNGGSVVSGGEDYLSPQYRNDGAVNDMLSAVALQPDGRIVAVGSSEYISQYTPFVFRFQTNGQLDPSFCGDGICGVFTQAGYGDLLRALLIEPDGSIVVGGATERFQTLAVIARLTSSGAQAGGAIFQIADYFYEQGSIYSLARQGDGKIVFGAVTRNDRGLGRLNADFTLDTTFGDLGTGYVRVQTGITSVNIDPLNRIVASGATDTVRVLP
ncbi:putative delta-60 repeat protein [Deinococcus metalli]|uniref:Putative delta-60 repeat protein n=1 Tax=Deinococcus metalli TaxID=1141878 RepID=A0A7W8NPZ2_9DEIO|nr:NPCBM/NEW2 domain-containing protein [Deinococcus metalli]MBB5374617.1 putative delta-60 repeat protein [Deinococcus metalli]GHF34983.1 hypothetical protein GCM10017781_09800 [Deinococcus metalli]